jgi:hypothetical protein
MGYTTETLCAALAALVRGAPVMVVIIGIDRLSQAPFSLVGQVVVARWAESACMTYGTQSAILP